MENSGWNQIRLVIGLIGVAMLIFLRLSGVLSIIDTCLFGLWFVTFLLISKDKECLPWGFGFTAFYTALLFFAYHYPLLEWNAPSLPVLQNIAIYGNKLAIVLVNALLYLMAVLSLVLLACAALSGLGCFKLKRSLDK